METKGLISTPARFQELLDNPHPPASVKNEPSSPSTGPAPEVIARLAAQLLPPMELPQGWEKMDRALLKLALTASARDPLPSPSEWFGISAFQAESVFDIVAREAVGRARCLLEHAAGTADEILEDRARRLERTRAQLSVHLPAEQTEAEGFKAWRGGRPPTMLNLTRFALSGEGRLGDKTIFATLREWTRQSVRGLWEAQGLKPVPVVFDDESAPSGCGRQVRPRNPHGLEKTSSGYTGFIDQDVEPPDSPGCYIREKFSPEGLMQEGGIGTTIVRIREFYRENKKAIGKSISASTGGTGGKTRAENAKKKKAQNRK